MRDVLVVIHDDVGQQSRLQAAFDLVRASQGRLLCVDLVGPDVRGEGAAGGGSLVMEAEVAPLTTVRDQVEASGLSAQWIERRDEMLPALSELAALADLIVMSAPIRIMPGACRRGARSTAPRAHSPRPDRGPW